jgi:predicted nucleic acid-binding protein
VNKAVIADTGPLVALFDRGDEHHEWALNGLGKIRGPMFTAESVVSEVLFLLRDMPRSRAAFLEFWSEGALRIAFQLEGNKAALTALLRKYADAGMSMAAATAVRLSELHPDALVWTLDKDFRIYRRAGRKVIPLFDWPR